MKEDGFIRQAMIITAVSTLLEIFGHLYISTIAGLGYLFYCIEYGILSLKFFLVLVTCALCFAFPGKPTMEACSLEV